MLTKKETKFFTSTENGLISELITDCFDSYHPLLEVFFIITENDSSNK